MENEPNNTRASAESVDWLKEQHFTKLFFTQEEERDGEETRLQCTVMTYKRIQKVVPCNSLYPFVCTRTAGKSNAMRSKKSFFLYF